MMPIKTIEVQQSQTYLTELLSPVTEGTEIILTQGNTPIARLVPIPTSPATSRVAGLHSGTIQVSEDFDDPLPDEFWLENK